MSTDSALSQYYRQPEIYITLPSSGQFYPEGALEMPATGELPVYPMTAKDDIIIKTPDALISGEAVAQVIQSCIPNIKDPWSMPASDVDYILIAIRIASYGNEMEIEQTCNECNHEHVIGLNLDGYIDKLSKITFNNELTIITYGEIKVHIKPLSYLELSLLQRRAFEEQQAIQLASNSEGMDPDEVKEVYNKILKNMTDINISTVSSGVHGIELPNGDLVVNKEEIITFVNNTSIRLFNKITATLDTIREKTTLAPVDIECPECKHKSNMPLLFDYSSFFV